MMTDRWRPEDIDRGIAAALAGAALAVYLATLAPTLSYGSLDGPELATLPYLAGLVHPPGYPLFTWLGWLFSRLPLGEVAYRLNLLSALMAAGTIGLLYGVIGTMLRPLSLPGTLRRASAAGVSLLFALTPTFWSQATIAEVYTSNTFLLALQLALALRWARLEAAAPTTPHRGPSRRSLGAFGLVCLAFALSSGTHLSSLAFAPGYALFVWITNRHFAVSPRALAVGLGSFAIGMLQYIWLPLRAGGPGSAMSLYPMPDNWQDFYRYTLGAFDGARFAYELADVPVRVIVYLDLLRQQFGLAGIGIGVGGLWGLAVRQPRRWWLLAPMLLAHGVFFTQYMVTDLPVFFIPMHLLFAIALGVGAGEGLRLIVRWLGPPGAAAPFTARAPCWLALAAIPLMLVPAAVRIRADWARQDRSRQVAIRDFYLNVYDLLPPGAVLLSRLGIGGYDAFHWQMVYGLRPDVTVSPSSGSPEDWLAAGQPVYSTLPLLPARQDDIWAVPILLARADDGDFASLYRQQRVNILYRLSADPPVLLIPAAQPAIVRNERLAGLTLVGYDLDSGLAQPGGRIRLALYWDAHRLPPRTISTYLGSMLMESHAPGFGLLTPSVQEQQPEPGNLLVEKYWVVIPSSVTPGAYPLVLAVEGEQVTLQTVRVGGRDDAAIRSR